MREAFSILDGACLRVSISGWLPNILDLITCFRQRSSRFTSQAAREYAILRTSLALPAAEVTVRLSYAAASEVTSRRSSGRNHPRNRAYGSISYRGTRCGRVEGNVWVRYKPLTPERIKVIDALLDGPLQLYPSVNYGGVRMLEGSLGLYFSGSTIAETAGKTICDNLSPFLPEGAREGKSYREVLPMLLKVAFSSVPAATWRHRGR